MPNIAATYSTKTQNSTLDWIPWMIAVLVIAHLLAFIYWMYRLAVEKPAIRNKTH